MLKIELTQAEAAAIARAMEVFNDFYINGEDANSDVRLPAFVTPSDFWTAYKKIS